MNQFKIGDLVEIQYGSNPLAIVLSEIQKRHQRPNVYFPPSKINTPVDTREIKVSIIDSIEVGKRLTWYWDSIETDKDRRRLGDIWQHEGIIIPSLIIAYIHPLYLKSL